MAIIYFKENAKLNIQENQILHISDNNTVRKREQIIGNIFTIRHNSLQTKNDPS